jgi:hypothetical protein
VGYPHYLHFPHYLRGMFCLALKKLFRNFQQNPGFRDYLSLGDPEYPDFRVFRT